MEQQGSNSSYFGDLAEGIKTTLKGLKLSMRHFKKAKNSVGSQNIQDKDYFAENTGIVTLQYPHESIPVPDHGRYRLHNEMDDCIVCDKCAKICPVDCIDIEPIKSTEQIGVTSDGSPIRLYAAKFDIDMAKCCYCGLCTTVCPTECLTMTKAYDFSEFDVKDFNYHYSNLSPEVALEKKQLYEQYLIEKEALKAESKPKVEPIVTSETTAKPGFKPVFKPKAPALDGVKQTKVENEDEVAQVKPVFKPVFKKPTTDTANTAVDSENKTDKEEKVEESTEKPVQASRPVFKPVFKKPTTDTANTAAYSENKIDTEKKVEESTEKPVQASRPVFKPVFKKPTTDTANTAADSENKFDTEKKVEESTEKPVQASRPVFKPVFKKPASTTENNDLQTENKQSDTTDNQLNTNSAEEKPKPKFVPKFKPKTDS